MDSPVLIAASLTLSPLTLFVQADWVVKAIMLGLLGASLWTWAIIVSQFLKNRTAERESARFEMIFHRADSLSDLQQDLNGDPAPPAALVKAAMAEWKRSIASAEGFDKNAARDRLADVLEGAISGEIDRLSERLNILATVGSVAPFVGLLGTVWGIMRSFTSIAAEQNTSLAVVAPGIAEALFATAIGLFAAIPAVIAYNRFGHSLNRIEVRLTRFGRHLHGGLSRDLDRIG